MSLLERIKVEANKRDVPYQSLIKAWLAEDVDRHGKEARDLPIPVPLATEIPVRARPLTRAKDP